MGSKIKRSLFKYLIISLTLAIILSVVVQGIAQNISTNIQLKYVAIRISIVSKWIF